MTFRVAVLSPSNDSLYTTTVVAMLRRQGIEVSAIYVKRLINPQQLISEARRDGIRKVWRKLVQREKGYDSSNVENLAGFRKSIGITQKKVTDFKSEGIPIVYCRDQNEDAVIADLVRTALDLVVFTGGGLIRQGILENSGAGVLNCHMGLLPVYRGMDVVEWSILENAPQGVGLTVHFMDREVDTGDILTTLPIERRQGETIKQLRDRMEPITSQQMVETCCAFLKGELERKPQKRGDGKQYFIMHPRLLEVAERYMAKSK